MNTPYVKQYDVNGVLTNPIEDKYLNSGENRKSRRRKEPRILNNANTYPVRVVKTGPLSFTKMKLDYVQTVPVVEYEDHERLRNPDGTPVKVITKVHKNKKGNVKRKNIVHWKYDV